MVSEFKASGTHRISRTERWGICLKNHFNRKISPLAFDVVFGGEGNDFLWGGEGNDFLYGDEGNDTLIGNDGTDYFVIQSGFGSDEVLDFIDGTDLIGLGGGLTFADLSITGSNGNTLISSNNELLATLTGVEVGLITSADFTVLV